jgi:flagellar biosynthesis/type III secretory pathway chaperone
MQSIYPATIRFSDLKVFFQSSLLSILHDSRLPVFDLAQTQLNFRAFSERLYIPNLKFILSQEIKVNLILTGDFIQQAQTQAPEIISLIKSLVNKGLVHLVADTYWGESLSCIYNPYWWSQSLLKTYHKISEVFNQETRMAFLPQLYRSLELERVCHNSVIDTFILRELGKKQSQFSMKLSDLRRYNGHNVYWIEKDMDTNCNFHYVPDSSFFQINGNIFQPDLKSAAKTFALAVGFTSSEFTIKTQTKRLRTSQKPLRINEKPSLSPFNTMEKAVIRLWEYGLVLLLNELNYHPSLELQKYFEQFCALQNSEFLFYLNKSLYSKGHVANFSSPYEAFATIQARIKQIEILIKENVTASSL